MTGGKQWLFSFPKEPCLLLKILKFLQLLGTDHLILRKGGGGGGGRAGGYSFLLMLKKFLSLQSLVQLFFLSSTEQNVFYSDEEDGIFLCGEMFQS